MDRRQNIFKRLSNEGARSRCLQAAFCKKAKRPERNCVLMQRVVSSDRKGANCSIAETGLCRTAKEGSIRLLLGVMACAV